MVLMPQSDMESARVITEKLRDTLSAYRFHESYSVTASFGVTGFLIEDDVNSLLKRLDNALYNAKHGGKNRVETLAE
jgi:PleD family two-component response regulator